MQAATCCHSSFDSLLSPLRRECVGQPGAVRRRPNQVLLAAGVKEYERRELSRRAERRRMAGTSATSSAAVRRELDVKVLSVVRLHSDTTY